MPNIYSAFQTPQHSGAARCLVDISGKLLINMIRKLVQNIGAFKLQYNWSTAGGADIPETHFSNIIRKLIINTKLQNIERLSGAGCRFLSTNILPRLGSISDSKKCNFMQLWIMALLKIYPNKANFWLFEYSQTFARLHI